MMEIEQLKQLQKVMRRTKRIASEHAAALHDLVEEGLPEGYQQLPQMAQQTYEACQQWAEAAQLYQQAEQRVGSEEQ